jgi:ADP-heptose:LPS heptosyltransferase
LASISCNDLAQQLLVCCLEGERWPDGLLDKLVTPDCSDALFRVVVERLADLFEPRLCEVYAEMFSRVLARATGELEAAELVSRYGDVRKPRPIAIEPKIVFVLSRVTLGADVAITSVLLDAAKRRFPNARIVLVGSRKSWELFAGDPRIEHAPVTYLRSGSVRERLASWPELKELFGSRDSIVIDPDSRLTQLGLLPVCPDDRYRFFESRAYGGDGHNALPELAALWARATLEVEGIAPWIAPAQSTEIPGRPLITMSFGVGENQAKRIADPFEERLVQRAAQSGAYLLIDQGAGGEEAGRVERAIARSGAPPERVRSFLGPFAAFASAIAQSDLYIGYDSAGQHVAAACGVPLISIFAGFPSPRFLARWRPWGKGRIEVVPVSDGDGPLERCLETLERFVAW